MGGGKVPVSHRLQHWLWGRFEGSWNPVGDRFPLNLSGPSARLVLCRKVANSDPPTRSLLPPLANLAAFGLQWLRSRFVGENITQSAQAWLCFSNKQPQEPVMPLHTLPLLLCPPEGQGELGSHTLALRASAQGTQKGSHR